MCALTLQNGHRPAAAQRTVPAGAGTVLMIGYGREPGGQVGRALEVEQGIGECFQLLQR
jgi:hypothetical protein